MTSYHTKQVNNKLTKTTNGGKETKKKRERGHYHIYLDIIGASNVKSFRDLILV